MPLPLIDISPALAPRLRETFGEEAVRYADDPDTVIIAHFAGDAPVSVLVVRLLPLPAPLQNCMEGFIEFLEVVPGHRRQGLATALVAEAERRARAKNCLQVRAWSSEDRTAALAMWRTLGFGFCPGAIPHVAGEIEGFHPVKRLA
jgi:GNAT superfamily N-acetyltransferase